jgi:hypothetical protein
MKSSHQTPRLKEIFSVFKSRCCIRDFGMSTRKSPPLGIHMGERDMLSPICSSVRGLSEKRLVHEALKRADVGPSISSVRRSESNVLVPDNLGMVSDEFRG